MATSNFNSAAKAERTPADESALKELFVDELKDIFWAEQHLAKGLKKLAEGSTSGKLKSAFTTHLAETEGQIARLEKVFKSIGEEASAKKCEAMNGLLKEAEELLNDTEEGTEVRDVALISAAQKCEHYEIATYGTLRTLAGTLGYTEAQGMLEETLEEEKNADKLLTEIAEGGVNAAAENEKSIKFLSLEVGRPSVKGRPFCVPEICLANAGLSIIRKITILALMGILEIEGLGQLHYHEYGSGKKLMFAFHGYGMTGKQFDVLEKSLLNQYRIIGFDNFFHKTSALYEVKEASILKGLEPALLNTWISAWFKQFGEQRFSLMAYSIGANMALFLLENFAKQIDEVILLAPDGLVPHRGFHFLRTSFIGKKLFRKLIHSSWMMARALKFLRMLRVIDQTLYLIARHETDTHEKRLNAYFTIHFLKNIRPDIKNIAALINQNNIRCRLYFGEKDQLFPQSNGKKLLSLLDKPEVYVLPLGHWLVTDELDNYIAAQTA